LLQSTNNFTLPNWTEAVYPEKLRPLAAFSFSMISLSPTLRRLRGGPLVGLMVDNMKAKVGRHVARG
jgi:lysosomal acid phosphatase